MTAEDFREFVLDIYGVDALIDDRMYKLAAPPETRIADGPLIVYSMTDRPAHDVNGPTGRGIATFQVDCWAQTHIEARELADAVRTGLDGYIGEMGDTENVGVLIELDEDMLEPPEDGGQIGARAARLVVNVWY